MIDPFAPIRLNTGASMPSVGLGVFRAQPAETRTAVAAALAAGYRHVDTAQVYGNETAVATALRASGVPRAEIFVTSKVAPANMSPERIEASVFASIAEVRRVARIRGLLCGIHPGLEQAFNLCCKGPLALLTRYVTPSEIRRAGRARIVAHLKKTPYLHGCETLARRALDCAGAQRITVPGEAATADLIRELAAEALEARQDITRIEKDIEDILRDHPDSALIRSLPGMGVVLTAEFLAAIGNIKRFASADALAAAAGLAPVQRQSGKRAGWRRAYGGDKALKRVFYQSAFCAVTGKDPLSKAFYDRKRKEGKHHTQALIVLVRRRVTVLWTMLQRRETFDPKRNAA